MIGLDRLIKNKGYISLVTKIMEVRKLCCVLDKITQQLIFYDIISIINIVNVPKNQFLT